MPDPESLVEIKIIPLEHIDPRIALENILKVTLCRNINKTVVKRVVLVSDADIAIYICVPDTITEIGKHREGSFGGKYFMIGDVCFDPNAAKLHRVNAVHKRWQMPSTVFLTVIFGLSEQQHLWPCYLIDYPVDRIEIGFTVGNTKHAVFVMNEPDLLCCQWLCSCLFPETAVTFICFL